jgi:hypothetical protein
MLLVHRLQLASDVAFDDLYFTSELAPSGFKKSIHAALASPRSTGAPRPCRAPDLTGEISALPLQGLHLDLQLPHVAEEVAPQLLHVTSKLPLERFHEDKALTADVLDGAALLPP